MKNNIGDWSKAICHSCECLVLTTLVKRDVPVKDSSVVVRDLFVFACSVCDETVALPASSTDEIRRTLDVS